MFRSTLLNNLTTSNARPYAGDTISTLDLYRARYRRLRRAEIVQFLAAPIDIRTRRDLQRDLAARDPALED